MGIVRVAKNSNYVTMNRAALNDKRLSWRAKGIMAYLLSMPDDWVFYMEELQTHSTDGKTSFTNGFKELKDCGYVERKPIKDDESGKIIRWETIVHEIPIEVKPQSEKPHTGKPESGKPTDWKTRGMENHEMVNEQLLSTDNNQVLNIPSTDNNQVLTDKDKNVKNVSSVSPLIDKNFVEIKNAFEENVRAATFKDLQEIDDAMNVYEPALVLEAIRAGASNARSFKYIVGILDNWRLEFKIKTYADWQQKIGSKGGTSNGGNQRSNRQQTSFQDTFGHDVGF